MPVVWSAPGPEVGTPHSQIPVVIDQCLQLFGGYGFTVEYPISRFYTDARIQRIYGGTSEIMRELVARSMLGKA